MAIPKHNKGEPQFNEPEETTVQQETIKADKEMLVDEPIIDRAHAAAHSTGETTPEWTPPPFQGEQQPPDDQEAGEQPASEFATPGYEELSEQDKEKGSVIVANILVDGYENIWEEGANMFLPISQKAIDKLEESGKVDFSMPVPTRDSGTITAGQAIENFNEEATDVLEPDPEFKPKVVPIIASELAKRNIGITPLQQLLYHVGIDVFGKVREIRKVWIAKVNLINAFKEATLYYRGGGRYPAPAPPQQPNPEPQQHYQQEEPPAANQQPPVMNNPSPATEMFDTTNPIDAFEKIQSGRDGSGSPIPPQAMPHPFATHQKPRKPYTRPIGKGSRGKYKKKKKGNQNKT